MAKIKVEVDLDWIDQDGCAEIDDEIKDSVVENVKCELIGMCKDEVMKRLDVAIANALEGAVKTIEDKVDDFIESITYNNLSDITIPCKEDSWSSIVKNIPLTEYIGKRFEEFINEKRYDENFCEPRYRGDAKYSTAYVSIQRYLDKELSSKVSKMVREAQSNVEKNIVEGLEKTLKENLAAETIKKMNIPQALENLQRMSIEADEGSK